MIKFYARSTALTCAALCLGLSLSAASASAKDISSPSVRLAQQRLIQLGYYTGDVDGAMGAVTKDALRDFQARNGLEVSGALTATTAQMLKDQSFAGIRGYGVNPYTYSYNGYNSNYWHNAGYAANGYAPNGYYHQVAYNTNYAPVAYNGTWNGVRSQAVPIRFGNLVINNDVRNGTYNYSVTLNGRCVLMANSQPQPLRVSQTYRLNGEDSVVFTAVDGTGGCSYKSYLLTVKADGTYIAPQQVGDCSGENQAWINNGAINLSFVNSGYNELKS